MPDDFWGPFNKACHFGGDRGEAVKDVNMYYMESQERLMFFETKRLASFQPRFVGPGTLAGRPDHIDIDKDLVNFFTSFFDPQICLI
jgi:hypothetical protein